MPNAAAPSATRLLRGILLAILLMATVGILLVGSAVTPPETCTTPTPRILIKDSARPDSVAEFAALDAAGKTQAHAKTYLPLGKDSAIWVALDLIADPRSNVLWLFSDETLWEDVRFYPSATSPEPLYHFGLALPYQQRPIKRPDMVIPVSLEGASSTVYLRLYSRHLPTFSPIVCTPEVMATHLRRTQFPTAFNIGFLACISLIAMLLMVAVRTPLTTLVFGLLVSGSLVNSFLGGALFGAIPDNPHLLWLIYIAGTTGLHWFMLQGTLWLAREAELSNRWQQVLIAYRWLILASGVVFGLIGEDWVLRGTHTVSMGSFLLTLATVLVAFRRLQSDAFFVALGIALFLGITLVAMLSAENLISEMPGSRDWFSYGLTLMCLSFALAVVGRLFRDQMALRDAQTAQASAQAQLDAQERFLATMSHEIRTPLNGMLGTAELISLSRLDPEQQRLIGTLLQSGRLLNEIISDILDFSRIRSGRLHLEQQSFLLDEVMCQSMRLFRPLADSKGLILQLRYRPDLPLWLVGDAVRLQQILGNLYSNAIKFTDRGSVTLQVEHHVEPDQRQVHLQISMIDTGIGIASEQLARIFQPFEQAESNTSRRYGGSGLGLAICQSLAQLMNAQLSVTSQPGQGSCFTLKLRLPIDWTREQARRDIDRLFAGGRYLMLSEMQEHSRYRVKHFREHGVEVDVVSELAQVIERCTAPDCPYILVVIEHGDSRQELDWQALLEQPLPVLLISPWLHELPGALQPARKRFGLVRIPGTFTEWQTEIARLLKLDISQWVGLALHTDQERDHALRGRRFLVVEDNAVNSLVMTKLLERFGATVTCADNGRTGLECLATQGPFDAVLMDMEMPEMDGLEATRRIRQQEQQGLSRHQLVIGVTAHAFESHINACREAGMDRVIAKPVRSNHLLALLMELLPPRTA